MQPIEVNPTKFSVEQILYNVDGFSIAYGTWEDENRYLAVRWNGDEDRLGFPQTYGKPQWLILPEELTIPFTKALLETDDQTNKRPIAELLRSLF